LSCQPKFNHVGFARGSRPVPVLEQITAEDGSRLYATPDGNRYPSVTTILADQGKEAIDAWRARVGVDEAKRISLRATTRGTRLHSYAEHYLNNVSDFLDANDLISKELFHSFQPILEPINNIHCQETRLYSHYLKLAGTVDCIGEYNGRLSIIDFKTASKPKQKDWIKSYFMQCAAYAIMYEEMTGIPVPQLVVLIAVEDSEPQIFIEKRNDWAKPLIEVRKRFGGY
jgi:genome maintenance exonuclease 1